jgi:hypothetical protein
MHKQLIAVAAALLASGMLVFSAGQAAARPFWFTLFTDVAQSEVQSETYGGVRVDVIWCDNGHQETTAYGSN